MNENLVSDRPPIISLLRILAMVIFGFLVLGSAVGLFVLSLSYHGNLLEALADPASHQEIRTALLLSQGAAAITGLILVPWLYIRMSEKRTAAMFFHDQKNWGSIIIVMIVIVIGLGIAISPVVEWNTNVEFPEWMSGFGRWARETEANAEAVIKVLTADMTPATFLFTFIVVAVIPAFGEEFVFRGLVQTEMVRTIRNPHVGIWITALLFSAFHFQFLGFVPRMLIGGFLGYLYYWSGNLWIPIAGHFFNNGIQLLGLYLYQRGLLNFDIESPESAPLSMVLTALVITAAGLWYLRKNFTANFTSSGDIV